MTSFFNSLYDDTRLEARSLSLKRKALDLGNYREKMTLKTDKEGGGLSNRMLVKTSLKITDFSLMKDLQDTMPDEDALVPQLETLNTPLVDLKGSITATIEDLEKMNKLGSEGPLALLGGAPNLRAVQVCDDFEHSTELHLLDESEKSINIAEFLKKDAPFGITSQVPSPKDMSDIPVPIFEANSISPASLYSGASSPAHFFSGGASSECLPTTIELTNQSNCFSSISPKKETSSLSSSLYAFEPSTSSSCGFNFFAGESTSCHSEDRYLQMRKKNNMASKRSRQTRREKELENEAKAKQLQEENERLKRKVQELEESTMKAKKYLIENVMRRK